MNEDTERQAQSEKCMIEEEKWEEMVKGPGKFEGEEPYTPWFYTKWLDGDGYPDANEEIVFDINDEDRSIFSALQGWVQFRLLIDDSGFVYGRLENP